MTNRPASLLHELLASFARFLVTGSKEALGRELEVGTTLRCR